MSADTQVIEGAVVDAPTSTPPASLVPAAEPQSMAPVTLFGTDDPVEFVKRVTGIADALADVLNKRKLFSMIDSKQGPRKFINVEGWTLLGSMVGVFPVVEWTQPIKNDLGQIRGWEARVRAVTRNGEVVGAAEAMCIRGESKQWGEYSTDNELRSMAQTRATSKALRGPLDFLVKLAGYTATPAEEMPQEPQPGQRGYRSGGGGHVDQGEPGAAETPRHETAAATAPKYTPGGPDHSKGWRSAGEIARDPAFKERITANKPPEKLTPEQRDILRNLNSQLPDDKKWSKPRVEAMAFETAREGILADLRRYTSYEVEASE